MGRILNLPSAVLLSETSPFQLCHSLPYYQDAGQLPEPLPDQNEIEQATQTLPKGSDYGGRLVIMGDKYVVKYGPLMTENEGYVLLFVEERLDLAAP